MQVKRSLLQQRAAILSWQLLWLLILFMHGCIM